MPPLVGKAETLQSTSRYLTRSILLQTVRVRDNAGSEASESQCEDRKLQGIDMGPCGSSAINYTSISLILFVVASLCLAVHLKTSRSRHRGPAGVRVVEVPRALQDQDEERRKRKQQAPVLQQQLDDERPRRNVTTRVATDLSDQQTKFSRRLTELQANLGSILQEQQRRDNEAATERSMLRTPEAAHVRDRVRDWELYQTRADRDIMARLERTGSIAQPSRLDEEERHNGDSQRADEVPEPLPEYAAADPLACQWEAPPYTP
ncbi:MAG: hypothetical protein LQ338_000448 [Usnochroma carphineum]|nr:MAG: hypothetical protein LQ338_000448 [Usnochroma carphineum]